MTKVDTGGDRIQCIFRGFIVLFPRLSILALHATINRPIVPKTYNQSSIEQLGRCSVNIRHNNNCVSCRFFEVPLVGPASVGMPDIELLGIIKVMYETIDNKNTSRKFDTKTSPLAESTLQDKQGHTGKAG